LHHNRIGYIPQRVDRELKLDSSGGRMLQFQGRWLDVDDSDALFTARQLM
jgi:hypothetical protein